MPSAHKDLTKTFIGSKNGAIIRGSCSWEGFMVKRLSRAGKGVFIYRTIKERGICMRKCEKLKSWVSSLPVRILSDDFNWFRGTCLQKKVHILLVYLYNWGKILPTISSHLQVWAWISEAHATIFNVTNISSIVAMDKALHWFFL